MKAMVQFFLLRNVGRDPQGGESQSEAHPALLPSFWKVRLGGILLLCLALSSCAVGPNFRRPLPPPVDQYTQDPEPAQTVAAAGLAQQFDYGDTIAADWWQVFSSPGINEIIREAVAQNRNLAAAEARLRQSRELLYAGYGVFFPQANASLAVMREKFSPVQFGLGTPGKTFTLYTPQVSAGYVLDLFGGQRRTVEGLAAQVDYQDYTARATYITLLGNVINAAVAQAAYQAQIEATEEIIKIVKEQLKLTETQSTAGTAPMPASSASRPSWPLRKRLCRRCSRTSVKPAISWLPWWGALPANGPRPSWPSKRSPCLISCR
jgi:hypothetical protein